MKEHMFTDIPNDNKGGDIKDQITRFLLQSVFLYRQVMDGWIIQKGKDGIEFSKEIR